MSGFNSNLKLRLHLHTTLCFQAGCSQGLLLSSCLPAGENHVFRKDSGKEAFLLKLFSPSQNHMFSFAKVYLFYMHTHLGLLNSGFPQQFPFIVTPFAATEQHDKFIRT